MPATTELLTNPVNARLSRRYDPFSPPARPPLAHQVECLKRMRRPRVLCGAETRLGKITMFFHWLHLAKVAGPTLVVSPISAHDGWVSDAEADGVELLQYSDGAARVLDRFLSRETRTPFCVLTNSEQLFTTKRRSESGAVELKSIAQMPWAAICYDEVQGLRNVRSQRFSAICSLREPIQNRCALTGQLRPESLLDLYGQMFFLHGFFMGCRNFWQWRSKYFELKGYDWVPKPGMADLIKAAAHSNGAVMTRKEAGIEIPVTVRKEVVRIDPWEKKIYSYVRKHWYWPDKQLSTKFAVVTYAWLSMISGGSYAHLLPEGAPRQWIPAKRLALLRMLANEPRQVVVAYRFNKELDDCWLFLEKNGIKVSPPITGRMSRADRAAHCRMFRRGDYDVLLAQAKAINLGVDLACASVLVWYSVVLDNLSFKQVSDRLFHPLKKTSIEVVYLVAKDTVDEENVELLLDKRLDSRLFQSRLHRKITDIVGKRPLCA